MAREIDADVLYAEITGSDNKRADQLMWECYAEMVERQPTIDPVKHGKWGESYYHYGECDFVRDCSVCGEPYSPPTRFCPNCGARMDGDSE